MLIQLLYVCFGATQSACNVCTRYWLISEYDVWVSRLLVQVKRSYDRYMQAQYKSIQDAKVNRKSKCGILPFVANFEVNFSVFVYYKLYFSTCVQFCGSKILFNCIKCG